MIQRKNPKVIPINQRKVQSAVCLWRANVPTVYLVKPVNSNTYDTAEDIAALETVNTTDLDVVSARSADISIPNYVKTLSP